jgi:hypothetical protein
MVYLTLLRLASATVECNLLEHVNCPAHHGFEKALVCLVHAIRRETGRGVKEGMRRPEGLQEEIHTFIIDYNR